MGAVVSGYLQCDECAVTVQSTATFTSRDKLWWDLPEGWKMYNSRCNRPSTYCPSCQPSHGIHTPRRGEGLTFEPVPNPLLALITDVINTPNAPAKQVLNAVKALVAAWEGENDETQI